MLRQAQQEGFSVLAITDALLTKKLQASAGRSFSRYLSYAKTAEAFCGILNLPFLPTSPHTVYRFAALITHESTLRCILSAWRKFHHLAGYHWPAEHSPVLADLKAGTKKLQPASPVRPRIRKSRLRLLLGHCVQQGSHFRAMSYMLAYAFLLRVPSELLGQLRPNLLQIDSAGTVRYGPIRRKGQHRPQSVLEARCVCSSSPLLCAHMWASWLLAGNHQPDAAVFPQGYYPKFLSGLRSDLLAIGVPSPEVATVASHAFRHGAALDIHDQDGLAAACARGEWRSRAVTAYIPAAVIESRALAEALCEMSGDDEDDQ